MRKPKNISILLCCLFYSEKKSTRFYCVKCKVYREKSRKTSYYHKTRKEEDEEAENVELMIMIIVVIVIIISITAQYVYSVVHKQEDIVQRVHYKKTCYIVSKVEIDYNSQKHGTITNCKLYRKVSVEQKVKRKNHTREKKISILISLSIYLFLFLDNSHFKFCDDFFQSQRKTEERNSRQTQLSSTLPERLRTAYPIVLLVSGGKGRFDDGEETDTRQ